MAEREILGEIACQCCGERVPLKQQKNGLAMYSCDWCGLKAQAFAKKSDQLLRVKLPKASPAPEAGKSAPAADDSRPAYLRK